MSKPASSSNKSDKVNDNDTIDLTGDNNEETIDLSMEIDNNNDNDNKNDDNSFVYNNIFFFVEII